MKHRTLILIAFCALIVTLQGCSLLRVTGKVAETTAKVAWKTTKGTGKLALGTGRVTSKSIRKITYRIRGKQIVPLERRANSLYAEVTLNKKVKATFLVDTGASQLQISRSMAEHLDLNLTKAIPTMVETANGNVYPARITTLKEVRVKGARVKNVKAIVLDQDRLNQDDGLLGMSFLDHFLFEIDTKKPELVLQRRVVD